MTVLFVEYPKCSTCKKAKAWLDEHGVEYIDRDIVLDNPTADELATDGMLVKRPLLVGDDFAIPGFRESAWAEALL